MSSHYAAIEDETPAEGALPVVTASSNATSQDTNSVDPIARRAI
jgi:hypothetical protein